MVDSVIKDGLWDVYNNFHMGNAGELCAAKYRLTRKELDDYALKATGARNTRWTPVLSAWRSRRSTPQRKGALFLTITDDEEPKRIDLKKLREFAGVSGKRPCSPWATPLPVMMGQQRW